MAPEYSETMLKGQVLANVWDIMPRVPFLYSSKSNGTHIIICLLAITHDRSTHSHRGCNVGSFILWQSSGETGTWARATG